MKKRKKFLAFALAFALAAQPLAVQAEEFTDVAETEAVDVVDVSEVVNDGTVPQGEAGATDGPTAGEESLSVQAVGSSGENLLTDGSSTGEIFDAGTESGFSDSADVGGSEETVVYDEGPEIRVPLAMDAGYGPGFSLFSVLQYNGSYGAQLNANEKAVYDKYVELYVTNYSNPENYQADINNKYYLKQPISFKGTIIKKEDGTKGFLKNEDYKNATAEVYGSVLAGMVAFLYDYPEVFWTYSVKMGCSIEGLNNGEVGEVVDATIKVASFTPTAFYDVGEIVSLSSSLKENAEATVKEIQAAGDTTYEKVKAVHDYICKNAYYDHSGVFGNDDEPTNKQLQAHTAGPFFLGDGGIVCEGYAKAMKIFCDRLRIPCALIVGDAKSSASGTPGPHMWNYIKMDNEKWYMVDATWDDAANGAPRQTYLLTGQNTKGFNITIAEERELKQTFSSSQKYYNKVFTYPGLSDSSYAVEKCTHIMTETPAKAPTCGSEGNIQYWTCSSCKAYFCDEAGTEEITLSDTVRRATGQHNWVKQSTVKMPTCTEPGTDSYRCTVCNQTQERATDPLGHDLTAPPTEAKDATCGSEGNIQYWTCSRDGCGKHFSDAAGTNEVSLSETVIGATGQHKWVKQSTVKAPTCTEAGIDSCKCTVCNQTEERATDPLGHDLTAPPTEAKDATCGSEGNIQYWTCSRCGKHFSDAAGTKEIQMSETVIGATGQHKWVKQSTVKAPTCTDGGIDNYKCTVCNKAEEERATAPLGHTTLYTPAVVPTCTEPGNIEYWQCRDCGRYFSNESGTTEIKEAALAIPATGHDYGDWKVTKEATALAEGTETSTCACGAALTRTIPKLARTMTVNVSSLRLRVGQSFRIRVTGLAKGDRVKSWSSSNSKVASVSKYGTVKGRKSGSAVITVKLASGKYKRIRVTVQKGTVTTRKIALDKRKITLRRRKSYTLETTLSPVTSQQKVTYTSSNKKVATVNSKGKITARARGTAVITVRSGSKKITCRVTVK